MIDDRDRHGNSAKSAMPRKPKDPREEAARALYRYNGVLEDTMYAGKPMWMSYLEEVDVVLEAARTLMDCKLEILGLPPDR